MFAELKRAIFKKSNLILIFIVFIILFAYAYQNGLKTSFNIDHASDITRDPEKIETILFIKKFNANFFRIVLDSYLPIQILAPVLLLVPYLLSIYNEKSNHFRYLMVSRKGNKKYIIHKTLAIAISGTLILALAEILFGIFTYFISYHDITPDFLNGLVINE